MKKILFLLLIFVINLNAYEIEVFNSPYSQGSATKIRLFVGNNGELNVKFVRANGSIYVQNTENNFYDILNSIKSHTTYYIRNEPFDSILKSDLQILNDFYTLRTNSYLNYLYNKGSFNRNEFISYSDYQILYNSDGLAVESIVNGKWSGLYDDSGQSGYLYNQKGDLLYVNGEPASFFEKINNKLLKRFKINLESIFIKKIFYPLLVLIFACVVLRSVIRLVLQAFLIRFYDKKISQLEKRREKIENA